MAENNSTNPFDNLRVDREHQDQSLEWFMQKIKALNRSTYQPNALLKSQKHKIANPYSGKMYFFKYDPVHAETLKYYDTTPVIFFLQKHPNPKFAKTHFYGCAIHYANYKMRLALLKKLYTIANTTRFDATKKLRITTQILLQISAANNLGANSMLKMYRYDAMQSPFLEIPSSSWATVALLPIENFKKKSKEFAWYETKANR